MCNAVSFGHTATPLRTTGLAMFVGEEKTSPGLGEGLVKSPKVLRQATSGYIKNGRRGVQNRNDSIMRRTTGRVWKEQSLDGINRSQ